MGCDQNSYSPNGIEVGDSTTPSMFDRALSDRTQTFVFPANTGTVCKFSDIGVEICLETDCFVLNGVPVTSGDITLEYIEIFEKGDMVVTNKTTTDAATGEMLRSGGEFYLQAYLNGVLLSLSPGCDWAGALNINPDLTGGIDYGMDVWTGSINPNGNLNWSPVMTTIVDGGGSDTLSAINWTGGPGPGPNDEPGYVLPFIQGWHNCDVFWSWPTPKTTVTVNVPAQYDNSNSEVFIMYNGEDNSLAYFDSCGGNCFESRTTSSNPNSIPIGIEAHILFLVEYSEATDIFTYALASDITISDNLVIDFFDNDLQTATETELVDLVNLLD